MFSYVLIIQPEAIEGRFKSEFVFFFFILVNECSLNTRYTIYEYRNIKQKTFGNGNLVCLFDGFLLACLEFSIECSPPLNFHRSQGHKAHCSLLSLQKFSNIKLFKILYNSQKYIPRFDNIFNNTQKEDYFFFYIIPKDQRCINCLILLSQDSTY